MSGIASLESHEEFLKEQTRQLLKHTKRNRVFALFARHSRSTFVCLFYLIVGLLAFFPLLLNFSHELFGSALDYQTSVWFISAVAHQLAIGHNPFFSNALDVPTGVNLMSDTSSPLLGIIVSPLTFLFGPVVSTNLLFLLSMPMSATSAYFVLRKWNVGWQAATIGGLIYGYSPYMVSQGLAHLSLIFAPLPPLIVLTIVSIARGEGSPFRLGALLGLLMAAQFLISAEVLAIVMIMTVVVIIFAAVTHLRSIAPLLPVVLPAFLWAVLISLVFMAFPLWMLLAGPQHFHGPTWPVTNQFHNNLFSFIVPGSFQNFSFGLHSLYTHHLEFNLIWESNGYIGIPVIVPACILFWRSRRSWRMHLAAMTVLVAGLLSLGSHFTTSGIPTRVDLPFYVFTRIPLLYDIFPSRISLVMDAGLARMLAFGLDDFLGRRRDSDIETTHVKNKPSSIRTWVSVSLLLVVQVITWLPKWPYAGTSAGKLPASVERSIPSGDPVAITYPYVSGFVSSLTPMIWQAQDSMKFRLLGGDAYHPLPNGQGTLFPSLMSPPGLQHFLGVAEGVNFYGPAIPITPTLVETVRAGLDAYRVKVVIVSNTAKNSEVVIRLFDKVLGRPKVQDDGFTLWLN